MFDCVAPTRNARHGTVWTLDEGQIHLKGARFRLDTDPVDPECDCYTCSVHNLRFLVRLAALAREHVQAGSFEGWRREWLERYRGTTV
jgi:queuine tRNA-ribosyltransferase